MQKTGFYFKCFVTD